MYSLQENSNDSHWPSRSKISLFPGLTRNDDAFKNNRQLILADNRNTGAGSGKWSLVSPWNLSLSDFFLSGAFEEPVQHEASAGGEPTPCSIKMFTDVPHKTLLFFIGAGRRLFPYLLGFRTPLGSSGMVFLWLRSERTGPLTSVFPFLHTSLPTVSASLILWLPSILVYWLGWVFLLVLNLWNHTTLSEA